MDPEMEQNQNVAHNSRLINESNNHSPEAATLLYTTAHNWGKPVPPSKVGLTPLVINNNQEVKQNLMIEGGEHRDFPPKICQLILLHIPIEFQ